MRFRFPAINAFSFWFGFILSTLLWWVFSALRTPFREMRERARERQAERKEKSRAFNKIEDHYRQTVLQQAQGLHLAAPLFALDEILEPPLLMAPPPRIEPGMPAFVEDIVDTTLPYLPAWPELAAIYKAPTLTLSQALSGNSDIILTGQSGMGKTVTLACLASRLARRDPEPGLPQDVLPFLIHVADLNLPAKKEDPLALIIELVSEKAPSADQSRLPDFVRQAFTNGRALLLMDGTDELTPDGLKSAVEFIRTIKRIYPKTRIVTTASTEYLDGLVSLNFIPFALAAWSNEQRAQLLQKWSELWARYVAVEAWAQTSEQVDPLLLNGWLQNDPVQLTPLELTLKIWGTYAGDIRGPRPLDAIETHLRRLTPDNAPRAALEMLAMQISLNAEPIFDPRKAREWIKSFEPEEPSPASQDSPEEAEGESKNNKSTKQEKPQAPSMGLITKLVESGLLTQHSSNRMRFAHPTFGGFLAGKALSNYKADALLDQPPWIGKYLAMYYLAAQGDASPLVEKLLSQLDRPLSRNLLVPGRWLRDAPHEAAWRGAVMAKLAELLQQHGQPLGLRGQALAAFVESGESSAAILFRQLLAEHESEVLQLAALGAGALQDTKSVEALTSLLNSPHPNVQKSACLALIAIGNTAAMDSVADALLHGDENLRRAAAEAMANHPTEGQVMLREGGGMKEKEQLDVRRAVAYGLGRIRQPWAEELLKQLQLEDDQWAVRDAASQIIEEHQKPDRHIPQRLPAPSDSPWLIAYASKQGIGITPDKPPTDLLLQALKMGTDEERLASLSYLRMMPVEGVFGVMYQAMYGGAPELREAVFQAFSEMAARGVDVPDPVQFGVGY